MTRAHDFVNGEDRAPIGLGLIDVRVRGGVDNQVGSEAGHGLGGGFPIRDVDFGKIDAQHLAVHCETVKQCTPELPLGAVD